MKLFAQNQQTDDVVNANIDADANVDVDGDVNFNSSKVHKNLQMGRPSKFQYLALPPSPYHPSQQMGELWQTVLANVKCKCNKLPCSAVNGHSQGATLSQQWNF